MQNIDSNTHVRGESIYLDDIPVLQGTLYAACFDSTIAHGKIISLDVTEALQMEGVVHVFTHEDITGMNQIGGIVPDEPLLADGYVHFCGMPIALVVAETDEKARAALKKIKIEFEPLEIVTDPRMAFAKGDLIVPPRKFQLGNVDETWASCEHVFEGVADSNGQEHLYIETQGAYALPVENDALKVYSSTQGPTAVQRAVSQVTGLQMHQIEVDVTRLGGGFGGKEDQANMWAALCALAAHTLKKPVKYSLNRMEDMRMTGKRHPYSTDYKIGLDKELKIIAYEATFYQNGGAAADLSPAILERTLFHCTNTYYVPNVRATAYSCRTNLPPNTAFRGFGGPQGMFVMEAAIAKAADALGIDASIVQQKNLLATNDEFPYGQKVNSEANECWQRANDLFDLNGIKKQVAVFNAANKNNTIRFCCSFTITPVCFNCGQHFTGLPLKFNNGVLGA